MHKIILPLLTILFFIQLSAGQTFTRKVLFEEATNASCVPCAQNNPTLTAFLNANPSAIIAIKIPCFVAGL
jgi:hypothetical protein